MPDRTAPKLKLVKNSRWSEFVWLVEFQIEPSRDGWGAVGSAQPVVALNDSNYNWHWSRDIALAQLKKHRAAKPDHKYRLGLYQRVKGKPR